MSLFVPESQLWWIKPSFSVFPQRTDDGRTGWFGTCWELWQWPYDTMTPDRSDSLFGRGMWNLAWTSKSHEGAQAAKQRLTYENREQVKLEISQMSR